MSRTHAIGANVVENSERASNEDHNLCGQFSFDHPETIKYYSLITYGHRSFFLHAARVFQCLTAYLMSLI